MTIHELKSDPHMFTAVWDGLKTCEIRYNDRGYVAGDKILLRETRYTGHDMSEGAPLEYTGREIMKLITHVFRGPALGVISQWVALSLKDEEMRNGKSGYAGCPSIPECLDCPVIKRCKGD